MKFLPRYFENEWQLLGSIEFGFFEEKNKIKMKLKSTLLSEFANRRVIFHLTRRRYNEITLRTAR